MNPDFVRIDRSLIEHQRLQDLITSRRRHMQYIIGRHNVDNDGVPTGGTTTGTGIHIEWQNGALREKQPDGGEIYNPQNGAFVEGVIEAAIDRVEHYQSTRFACHENDEILGNLRAALVWCQMRTKNRQAQGVEGTHELHETPDHQSIAEGVLGTTVAAPGDDREHKPYDGADDLPEGHADTPQADPPLEPDHADL